MQALEKQNTEIKIVIPWHELCLSLLTHRDAWTKLLTCHCNIRTNFVDDWHLSVDASRILSNKYCKSEVDGPYGSRGIPSSPPTVQRGRPRTEQALHAPVHWHFLLSVGAMHHESCLACVQIV